MTIDIDSFLEDGHLDADERDQIRQMLEEEYGEVFGFKFGGRGGRFGPDGPSSEDAEAFFGVRVGSLDA